MKILLQLYRKDLLSLRMTLFLFPALVIIWDGYLYTQVASRHPEAAFGLAWIPFSVFPFLALWNAFQAYRQEWSTNTSYLLLSLPVQGWKIAAAKLAAVVTEFTLHGAIALAGVLLILRRIDFFGIAHTLAIPELFSRPMILTYLKALLFVWFFAVTIGLFAQFAYLISRLVDRWQGLVAGLTFLLTFWLLNRFSSLVAPLLRWVPDITFNFINQENNVVYLTTHKLDSAPLAALVIFTALVFLFSAWLIEHEVEV